jgi:hypothetical protein
MLAFWQRESRHQQRNKLWMLSIQGSAPFRRRVSSFVSPLCEF